MLQSGRNILSAALAVIAFSCIACEGEEARSHEASGPQVSPSGSQQVPFEVDAIIRQVHFAYRPEQDGWRGGHSTYDVKATAQGLILTPVRYRNLEPQEPELSALPAGAPQPSSVELETGAPLFLGAARVTRGDVRLSVEAPRGEVAADGHLTFVHGALVEHLRNSEQGVEQSWSFEAAPGAEGELRILIPVKGLAHTLTSEEGLHFADARTGFGVRYGQGTWVDGKGRRTAVPAEYGNGHIQLRVPEEVLALSAYPAVLDTVISQEMIIDGRMVSADTAVRSHPAMAFNGTDYLLVWKNLRGNQTSLYATRVSSTGAVLDPAGIVVSNGPGNAADPQVASNNMDFYVVWSQFHGETWNVRGTRITSEGEVSAPGGTRLSPANKIQSWPRVASDGNDYLVTWYMYNTSTDSDVFARRVSSTGELLDTSDIPISNKQGCNETTSAVASNGTAYLIAWSDECGGYSRIYARLMSSDGVLGEERITVSSETVQYTPAIASNGTDFLIVWTDYRNSPTRDLYGTRVTGSGTVVDGAEFALATDSTLHETYVSVASNGIDYFAAWTAWNTSSSTFQNLGRRISASNPSASAAQEPTRLVLSPLGGNRRPTVAYGSSRYFVVWESASGSTSELSSAWVSSTGTVSAGSGFPLESVSSLFQTEPVVASNGSNYLVVWTEMGSSTIQIHGTRVSLEGGTIDLAGLQIGSSIRERQSPAVTSNGTDYFVTWMDYRSVNWDIYGARVAGTGAGSSAVLDTSGIPISTHEAFQNVPAVASDGTDYLVVWRQDAGGRGDIYGARVESATGKVLDPGGIALATHPVEHYTPRVAFNGSHYLSVWAEEQGATGWDIRGVRVSPTGELVDTSAITISNHPAAQSEPDVASDGADFFVAWTDYRSGSNHDIYGARVSGEGLVLDPEGLALCTDPVQEYSPRVVFDGATYVAVWADYRWDTYWDVYGTQVTSSGTVVTPDGFQIVYNARETEPTLSLASAGNQQSLAVFSRYDMEPNQGSRRVRGSFFSF